MKLLRAWRAGKNPYVYADMVPVDLRYRALRMRVDDVNKALMGLEAGLNNDPKFDLWLLEAATDELVKEIVIEANAMHDPADGAF